MESSLDALKRHMENGGFRAEVELYTPCYNEAKSEPYRAACQQAYIDGAKSAAALTQELGEIYAQISSLMTPAQINKCQAIFAKNKEIVDAQ